MSDLHRAIQERTDDFRPDRTPTLQALRDRKRRRDQRRAGAAVALSVAAVLGVVIGPAALGLGEKRSTSQQVAGTPGGIREVLVCGSASGLPPCASVTDPERVGQLYEAFQAGTQNGPECPAVDQQVWRLIFKSATDSTTVDVPAACGSTLTQPRYEVTDDERDLVRTILAEPITPIGERLVAFTIRYQSEAAYDGPSDDARIKQCLDLPNVSSPLDPFFTSPPTYNVSVREQPQIQAFRACLADIDDLTVLESPAVAAQPPRDADQPVIAPAPTGATVCDSGDSGDGACRTLTANQAGVLVAVFNQAKPLGRAERTCRSLAEAFTVTFVQPGTKPVPYEVSKGCGPLTIGSQQYRLDPALQDAVARAYRDAQPVPAQPSGFSLSNLTAACGPTGAKQVSGKVTGPPGLLDFDGLLVEVRTEQGRDGSTRLTTSEFTIQNGDPRGEEVEVVLRRDDGQVLVSEQVDLRLPRDVICR